MELIEEKYIYKFLDYYYGDYNIRHTNLIRIATDIHSYIPMPAFVLVRIVIEWGESRGFYIVGSASYGR